jgi:aldehyde:ferredoxin oxidoreductase
VNRFYHVKTIAALYSALTGIDVSPEQLMESAERAWTVGKLLNIREGFDRRQDRPPEAWFRPLIRDGQEHRMRDYDGTLELTREDVGGFLDDYYEERGWDKETGLPTREKLAELGLGSMAGDLSLPD